MVKRAIFNSLCVLGVVLFVIAALVPSFTAPSADAAAPSSFSSIAITSMKPTVLHPAETREITLTVKNNGGMDTRGINLAFTGTETVSIVGPTVVNINILNAWESKEVKIVVHVKEGAANGVYPLSIACSWRGVCLDPEKGYVTTNKTEVQLGISFNVIGTAVINAGDITTDPADIRPGNLNVKVSAAIENSGEADTKDMVVKLICNSSFKPSWSGTERSYIGMLNIGDSKNAIFHIDIADNIKSNTYSIPLQISYKDMGGREYEVMRSVDILVKPKPEFEIVSYHTEPAKISAGDTGVKLHVRIRNVGSEKADSVSVRSTGEAAVPFEFDVKSDYVGNLKPDEEWTAVLKFDVDMDALPKTYQQGIEIRCTGDRDLGDYNVYLFDKMIPVSVSSSSSGTFSVPGFGVLFALIALFVFFVLLRRKRKGV